MDELREQLRTIIRAETGALRNLPVIAAICCWVAAVLFVKYFSMLIRYLGASLFLSLVVSLVYPGCFRRFRQRLRVYLILGAMMTSFQLCWVHALYRVDPAFVSLLSKVSTPMITMAAFVFYREERVVIRSPRFLLGFAMGRASGGFGRGVGGGGGGWWLVFQISRWGFFIRKRQALF